VGYLCVCVFPVSLNIKERPERDSKSSQRENMSGRDSYVRSGPDRQLGPAELDTGDRGLINDTMQPKSQCIPVKQARPETREGECGGVGVDPREPWHGVIPSS